MNAAPCKNRNMSVSNSNYGLRDRKDFEDNKQMMRSLLTNLGDKFEKLEYCRHEP